MKIHTKICQVCECKFETKNGAVKTCGKTCSYKLRIKTRLTKHEPIEKVCLVCSGTFQDTSKKKQVTKCFECIQSGMVATRMANGSYVRTDEQNARLSVSLKKMYARGEGFVSEAAKKKMSEQLTAKWKTDEFREKVKQGYIKNHGHDHWSKTPAARELASKNRKGQKATESAKRNMRIAAAKRVREGRNKHSFFGKGGTRDDLGFYVRSCWEANFARYLIHEGKVFEYEPDSFVLASGRTYTPDFKVGDLYYEVKGYWTPRAKEKFAEFEAQYPDIKIEIVGESEYNNLCGRYSSTIQHWESK